MKQRNSLYLHFSPKVHCPSFLLVYGKECLHSDLLKMICDKKVLWSKVQISLPSIKFSSAKVYIRSRILLCCIATTFWEHLGFYIGPWGIKGISLSLSSCSNGCQIVRDWKLQVIMKNKELAINVHKGAHDTMSFVMCTHMSHCHKCSWNTPLRSFLLRVLCSSKWDCN